MRACVRVRTQSCSTHLYCMRNHLIKYIGKPLSTCHRPESESKTSKHASSEQAMMQILVMKT